MTTIRKLDACVVDVITALAEDLTYGNEIPTELKDRIDNWRFGKYGWTSPVNLMITAAWYKWLHPQQDICKIWSKHNGVTIEGGFSIRSSDESYTVKLICKHQLDRDFCSPNSGMQGSRALEKSRSLKRIDRGVPIAQRVQFDINLFQNIMNDINLLNPDQAKSCFCYFLEKGLRIKEKLDAAEDAIPDAPMHDGLLAKNLVLKCVTSFKDPQFVRVAVAAVLSAMINNFPALNGALLLGADGAQTAADARSQSPGDLWIDDGNGVVIAACEVKDPTKTFGFEIITAIENRTKRYPSIKHYLLVTAATQSVKNDVLLDPKWNECLARLEKRGVVVSTFTLNELLNFLLFTSELNSLLLDKITEFIKITPNLRLGTIQKWSDVLTTL